MKVHDSFFGNSQKLKTAQCPPTGKREGDYGKSIPWDTPQL